MTSIALNLSSNSIETHGENTIGMEAGPLPGDQHRFHHYHSPESIGMLANDHC